MRRSSILKISEATSLAIHAMAILSSDPKRSFCVKEIATELDISEAHLSKVLQRLSKAGYVSSARGPRGGFAVCKRADKTTLLDLYELIEGPLELGGCLFDIPRCSEGKCVVSEFFEDINRHIRDFLTRARLSDLGVYRDGLKVEKG
ncbi:MAG: Rrf2 family transcriptional regulator [Thermodesulfobacteriota bacterium]|nr:Rrf2 family transcriptional regulator [Thermodesulfobacteriota bacterium]